MCPILHSLGWEHLLHTEGSVPHRASAPPGQHRVQPGRGDRALEAAVLGHLGKAPLVSSGCSLHILSVVYGRGPQGWDVGGHARSKSSHEAFLWGGEPRSQAPRACRLKVPFRNHTVAQAPSLVYGPAFCTPVTILRFHPSLSTASEVNLSLLLHAPGLWSHLCNPRPMSALGNFPEWESIQVIRCSETSDGCHCLHS